MQPIHLLTGLLSNLFTLALLGTDIYLFREWTRLKDSPYNYVRDDAQRYLIWAVVVLAILLLGGFIVRLLLGKAGSSNDEPTMERSEEHITLERPEGHKLFVEFYGPKDAQPLILIHGWSSNSTQWYYLKKRLSATYRLILVDLPGLGKSEKVQNNDYSLAKFARDLDAVIALTGSRKPIVLGHSIGGMTILTYCKHVQSRLRERVAALVLVHTTFTNPVRTSILSGLLTALEKPVLRPLCHLMIWFAPLIQVSNWLKYLNGSQHLTNHFTGFAGTETRGQLDHTSRLSAFSPVGVIMRGMLAMFDYDATDVLPTIDVPVLVIVANKDRLTKPEAGEYIHQHIPNADLVRLQPSGHMGPLERGYEMAEAVDRFGQSVQMNTMQLS